MSIHLVERAALLDLPPAKKLVLMAFADAADRDTRVSAPGLVNVQRWASSKRSWVLQLTAELTAEGLLLKVGGGRRGKRAEYVVMPEGCCPEHGSVHTDNGSTVPDPNAGNGSAPPDSEPVDNQPSGSGTVDPEGEKGPERVQKGSTSYRTPSPATQLPTRTPSSSAPPADAEAEHVPSAQTLVGEWIDHCRKRPPGNVIGQVGKHLAALLEEGFDYEELRRGLALWHSKSLHPSTLPSCVNEVINAVPRTNRRQADTDAMFERAMTRAQARDEGRS